VGKSPTNCPIPHLLGIQVITLPFINKITFIKHADTELAQTLLIQAQQRELTRKLNLRS
jgi:hypothetical protein